MVRRGRNIVVFSDGTGNSAGKLSKTNVWRVYQALDLTDPQHPEQPRQFALYDDGVGSSSFKPLALLGGAFGVGLARNVRELYAFVCRTYAPGDRIYAFGFSRGAFTIRVLVGLIVNQGLVPYDGNEAEFQRHVASAYRAYRKNRFDDRGPGTASARAERSGEKTRHPDKGMTGWLVGPLRGLRDGLIAARDRLLGRPLYHEIDKIGAPGSPQPIEIEFIGLWDTVDAYGLPVDELTRAIDRFVWPLTMRDLNLHPRVRRARHALALDDERNTFHPRLWNERPRNDDESIGEPGGNRNTTHVDQERISQVWFAGMHSDVGGGYPDDGLAHVSLKWMMDEAAKYKLRFTETIRDSLFELSDENAPIHDSRRGLAGYYRYNPRRIENYMRPGDVTIERPKIHESVLRRIQAGHDGYAPIVPPPDFAIVRIDGRIEDAPRSEHIRQTAGPDSALGARREYVWNWVWWRRIVYFATLGATLLLLSMPLHSSAGPDGVCTSQLCIVSDGIDLLAAALPDFASIWTRSFRSHPEMFALLATLVALGLWLGGRIERAVHDAMRPLWYSMLEDGPVTQVFPAWSRPAPADRLVQWLRTRPAYQGAFWLLTQWILPVAFLMALGYLAVIVPTRVAFAFASSVGRICISAKTPGSLSEANRTVVLDPRKVCNPSGIALEAGGTYRLRIHILADRPWTDWGIPAGPNGVQLEDIKLARRLVMKLAVPLRRHLDQPWLKPMARIGSTGSDVYPLDPKPSIPMPRRDDSSPAGARSVKAQVYETEIVARSSGELFLYVNDVVLGPPQTNWFYANNAGAARITVQRVPPE